MFPHRPLAAALLGLAVGSASLAVAHNGDEDRNHNRVLLISIDGMHALDFQNCVAAGTCPNLAALGATGVNYTRTSTSRPSDSFPGLMALVSGGSPKLVGAYYDVAYDRVLAPPAADTGNGVLHGQCVPGVPNGTRTEYEEGNDIDQTQLNGGSPAYSKFDGGIKSIDPAKLIRDPYHGCAPVYPWNFVRANTIYGVIHRAGGFTAWSDKHAVYAVVSGPTGTAQPSNVDDYYSPEVNSNAIPLPGVTTATGHDCSSINNNGGDWTTDFENIKCYDQLKVNAVVNWIGGSTHLGDARQAGAADLRHEFPGRQRRAEAHRERRAGRLHRCRRHADGGDARGDPLRRRRDRAVRERPAAQPPVRVHDHHRHGQARPVAGGHASLLPDPRQERAQWHAALGRARRGVPAGFGAEPDRTHRG